MANTSAEYNGNGNTTTFAIPFPFLDVSHLTATVNSIPVAFTLEDSQWFVITPAPAAGAKVRIERTTPSDALLVAFEDASTLTQHDLNTALRQMFFLVQEALDDSLTAAELVAQISATALTIQQQFQQLQNWLANGQFYEDYIITIPYSPQGERVIANIPLGEAVRMQGNFSRCKAATMADLDTGAVFRVREYTTDYSAFTELGTFTYTPGSKIASFLRSGGIGTGDYVFTPGRYLVVQCATASETLRDLAIRFSFRRAF